VREKLLDRIRNNPRGVSFDDLDLLLKQFGYELRRVGGSHHVYGRKSSPPIIVARHGASAHSAAVKEVLRAIDELLEKE
jgi:predicted RNA binding protein YcfA (HicA-like mRNA interferase family)